MTTLEPTEMHYNNFDREIIETSDNAAVIANRAHHFSSARRGVVIMTGIAGGEHKVNVTLR